jgi:catechol 2,3-dioxygenase-like lactoylglutathione lyase family enzyme
MDKEAERRGRELRKREDLLASLRLETRLRRANPPPPARAEKERILRHDRIAEILRKVDDGSPDVAYVDAATAQLLRSELIRIKHAAPSPPAFHDDDLTTTPPVAVERSNTILYCQHWLPTVRFYRDDLGLPVVAADNDWYVEFRITSESSLSITDASRATIDHVGGQGITLSWRVSDLAGARKRLADRSLQPSEIRTVLSAAAFYVADPEGHRVEIWSEDHPDVDTS